MMAQMKKLILITVRFARQDLGFPADVQVAYQNKASSLFGCTISIKTWMYFLLLALFVDSLFSLEYGILCLVILSIISKCSRSNNQDLFYDIHFYS